MTEQELIHRAKQGDQSAFEQLVLDLQNRVFTLAFRMVNDREEAADLAQEAFLKALGTGLSLPLTEVGVTHTALGQPVYALTGRAAEMVGDGSVLLSISHEGNMAMAFCLWQG